MKVNSPEAIAINNEYRKKRGLPPWGEPDALVTMTVDDSTGIYFGQMLTIDRSRYQVVRIDGNDLLCRYFPWAEEQNAE